MLTTVKSPDVSVYRQRILLNFDYIITTFKGQAGIVTTLLSAVSKVWKFSSLGRLEIFTAVEEVVLNMWSDIGCGHLMTYFVYSTRC
jgi:hypothetical protein